MISYRNMTDTERLAFAKNSIIERDVRIAAWKVAVKESPSYDADVRLSRRAEISSSALKNAFIRHKFSYC